ncbi:MAG TPA: hypothetical protein VIY90_21725 [Steroidobacteraceae bacterium]
MGSQHQNESKSSPKEGQKSGQQAQQRSDDHTNSARAGEPPSRSDDSAQGGQKPQHGQQSNSSK